MLPLSVECANDGCNARFTPLLSRHHASICPLSLYSCLYHPVGCQATVRIADMESHITSCPYKQIKGLYPHLFNPIKELQAIVSALDRQHRALGNILQLQINQLRAAATSSPNSTAPQNNAAARRDEGTVTTGLFENVWNYNLHVIMSIDTPFFYLCFNTKSSSCTVIYNIPLK